MHSILKLRPTALCL